MSSASAIALPATGGFTEASFQAFLKGRDEPSWLVARRREAFAPFQALPWPTARDEEWRRTDIRALKLDAFAPGRGSEPARKTSRPSSRSGRRLSAHYATGIAQVNGGPFAAATRRGWAARSSSTWRRAVRSHPELLDRYLLTEAVTPPADASPPCTRRSGPAGRCSTCPKGVKVEAPLFSLVGLTREGRVDIDHTLSCSRKGPRPRSSARRPDATAARRRRLHAGAVEVFVGRGAKLRFVNIQNWDDGTWHFSRERAIVGPRRRAAVDRRRTRLAARQGQPGGRR